MKIIEVGYESLLMGKARIAAPTRNLEYGPVYRRLVDHLFGDGMGRWTIGFGFDLDCGRQEFLG